MNNREKLLKEYAQLTVKSGVNIQKGQIALINTDAHALDIARLVAEECWLAGAQDVILNISDERCTRLRYEHGELEVLGRVPQWMLDRIMDYPQYTACFIHIFGDDPDLLAGLPAEKIGKAIAARQKAMKPYREMMDKGENQWCIIAVPSPAWAAKVFPALPVGEAIDKLWEAIIVALRLDLPDPVGAWEQHRKSLGEHSRFLDNSGIRTLEIKSGIGTDLSVELAEGYRWQGGGDVRADGGIYYFPNMPTEEVFSMPHRDRVNGKVVASMPLSYQGNMIEGFSMTFKDGVVVDYTADKGYDTLTQMLSVDEGARRLGEVALVPYSSPIRRSGILFYNTLFDENASCHLAIGSAYADTMKGFFDLDKEERVRRGWNESATHVDFMFGTADLSIVGITDDGKRIAIFESGEWCR